MDGPVIALLATAATLAAPSAIAQVVLAPTVFHSADLPADAVTSFRVTCPSGYLAASGGVSTPAAGTTLLGVRPAGIRAFAFRLGNPATNRARRATVAVACRRLSAGRAPGSFFKLKQLEPKTLVVPPGGRRSVALACPTGTIPAGAGVDLAPGRQARAARFAGAQLSVRRITADLQSFSFSVRNSGTTARPVALGGNCITVVTEPHASRRGLHVRVTTLRQSIDPGRRKIARSCPRGWFSLAAGYRLPSPAVAVEAGAAVGGGGKWLVANTADRPARIELELACGFVQP